jgi:hypothetical protein
MWMGFARSIQLSERGPKFSVAVRACAEGRFTFEIFAVSGEPRTLQVESRHYSSPGDAERAGYEAIAAKGLQMRDIDKARRVRSGEELSPSPNSESGEVELGVLVPLVLVTNVIVAIIAWYAVSLSWSAGTQVSPRPAPIGGLSVDTTLISMLDTS